ncbi:hypothetical protein F4561_003449 [Lipingzhangella halophila]|uniref:AEC family transporter n=1 Tax=Lipingzhangella halophila TaxID=1783352 RepID=A0A7W7RIK0_9ACTN|nr:AEC family transporter [Lipingzhangella halophila]MBB4932629.1 hypothetical protein [Lipingzhangella halophila]
MIGVITGFGVISSIIAVGYFLGWRDYLGENGREVLTRLAFYVATPALLFDILSGADLSILVSLPVLVTGISIAVMALLFSLAGAARRWGAAPTVLGALCSSYVNSGNLGIPIAVYVLGDASLVAPVLLLQQLVFFPIGLTLLDLTHRAPGEKSGLLRIATMPFRTPVVVGSLSGVAVAATGWTPPAPLMQPVELVGSMSVPAVLLAFGISLRGSSLPCRGPDKGPVLLSVLLKTVCHPLLAYVLGGAVFGLGGDELFAVVVLAALPAAQNLFTYASHYDTAIRMTRDSVLLSTLLTPLVLVLIAVLLG